MASNSSAPTGLGLHLDPKRQLGPTFVGNIVNWMLLGTLAVQVYIYVNSGLRSKDALAIQLLVYVVFVIDIFQSIVSTHDVWHYTVASWGDLDVLNGAIPWSGALIAVLDGLISLLVQLFYAWRIRTLTRSKIFQALAVVIALGALVQVSAALAATTSLLISNNSVSSLQRIQGSIDTWLAGSFANDVVIAGCMTWLLYQARSRTVWADSQSLYDRLIIQVIQTGLVTTVVTGVNLFLWEKYRQDQFHLAASFILGKLYSNAFLSTLNGRAFRSNQHVARGETSTDKNSPVSTVKVHVMQDRVRLADTRATGGTPDESNTTANPDWKPTTSVNGGNEHVYELSSFPASKGSHPDFDFDT